MRLTAELNKASFDDAAKVRVIFGELTGRKVDDTLQCRGGCPPQWLFARSMKDFSA